MSMLSDVAAQTGYSTSEIAQVIRGEVNTPHHWDIVCAVAAVTGQSIDRLLEPQERALGHAHRVEPTNPAAVHDPQVTIYAEDADGLVTEVAETTPAPEPERDEAPEDKAADGPGRQEFIALKARLFADVAAITGLDNDSVTDLVGSWATAAEMAAGLRRIILELPSMGARVVLAA